MQLVLMLNPRRFLVGVASATASDPVVFALILSLRMRFTRIILVMLLTYSPSPSIYGQPFCEAAPSSHLISSTRKIYSRDAPCRGRDVILDPRAVLRSSDFDAIARKSKCHHSFKIKSCLTYGLTCWIFWGCTNEKGKNSKKLRNEYVTYLVHA